MQRLLSQLVAVCMVSLLPSAAFAGVIFDQTVDLTEGSVLSDLDSLSQSADDFQLQSGANTITDIHWWGLYAGSNTPTEPDDFTFRFYADAGGSPEIDTLHEFVVGDVGRADTGMDAFGFDVYAYSADIAALTLTANTSYWLSIVNDTEADIDDSWFWKVARPGGNGYRRSQDGVQWRLDVTGFRAGFRLTDDALTVPEPATITLFGVGLAGLGALGWKRRKS